MSTPLADAIDALLPQTQCTKCGYAGCRPYAAAIANGEADINQCPPGGEAGIRALARLLGREFKPLDPQHGTEPAAPLVAWIDEATCIGCMLCIKACPVDAIVGTRKRMHTVIAAECTGCELCIPVCPVDCIHLRQEPPSQAGADPRVRQHRRLRYRRRQERLAREAAELAERRRRKREALKAAQAAEDPRKAVIAAALERVRQKRARQTQRPEP
ncbi:MAG: RnfABCDGE type electron transport complex subunit B [Xanthomonadaceae bacterium]|nr:RnfABCDGE type electron transport complex subunit B [Xanthomonadaceae bacterium]